jgi:hypothetical protein
MINEVKNLLKKQKPKTKSTETTYNIKLQKNVFLDENNQKCRFIHTISGVYIKIKV